MITLYQYPPAFGIPSASPFCVKAEVLLKMAGVGYRSRLLSDPRKAAKKKLPYIDDDGTIIADSAFIRWHLEERHGADFDGRLTARDRAASDAFVRMIEEHLYWILVYSRWIEPDNWARLRTEFFAELPGLLRPLITRIIQKKVVRNLDGQGIGRHSREEIYRLGAADLDTLATWLADKPFFMGEQPSAADATVYGFLASIIRPGELPSPLRDAAIATPAFMGYCERMEQRYFA